MESLRVRLEKTIKADSFQARISETGARLLNQDIEEVEITSRDGLRLVGHWYPCENAR